ncbi:MAG: UspA domain protein [Solirubrobacterales bacterium]|jgi:nucleotide-binding universal stress UspA family protein|nr:UspA domain protein [Solirubrobacterales bacterium]
MFRTIVLALDGSDGSRRAIPIATELAKRDKARVVLVHVAERVPQPGTTSPPGEGEMLAELEKQAQELSEERIDTEVKSASIGFGGPAVPIAEIANQEDADLIVVGTRGHGAVAGVLVGSVTQRLLHIAHRPVLAVPPVG